LRCSLFKIYSTLFLKLLFCKCCSAIERLALLQWRTILVGICGWAFEVTSFIIVILRRRSYLLVTQVGDHSISIETCAFFFISKTRIILSARVLSISACNTTLSWHDRLLLLFDRSILLEFGFLSKNVHHTVL
jgi:hypothetical protein